MKHFVPIFYFFLVLLCVQRVNAQNGMLALPPVLEGTLGQPLAGINVAVCSQLATSAAAVSNNIATYTVSSTTGFVAGTTLQVSGFTGADVYFNTSGSIIGLSPTTISISLSHANASASSNGTLYAVGNSTTPCAPLATVFTDNTGATTTSNPGATDGQGNIPGFVAPGYYEVQIYGPTVATKVYLTGISCVPSSLVASCTAAIVGGVNGNLLQATGVATAGDSGVAANNVPLLNGNNALTGNEKHSGAETFDNLNGAIVVDGSTAYPKTQTGLASAITAAASAGTCVLIPPATTIQVTAGLTWNASNACIYGSGPTSVLQPTGSSTINIFTFAGSLGSTATLASNSNVGSTTVALTAGSVASLGLAVGNYIFITDTQAVPLQQSTRIKSISSDTLTIEDVTYESFTTAHSSTVQKYTPVSNVTVSNLMFDGHLNSGASTLGILLNDAVNSEISYIWGSNMTGSLVTGDTGYKNHLSHIFSETNGNAGAGDVYFFRETDFDVTDIHSSKAGFAPELIEMNGSRVAGLWSIGSNGRGFKISAASFNTLTDIHVLNPLASENGIFYDGGSHDNLMTNCEALGATGAGSANLILAVAGDNANIFTNCKFLYSASSAVDVATQVNANNNIITADFGTSNDLGTNNQLTTMAGQRVLTFSGAGCTTAAGANSTCTTSITWPGTGFADTNYLATCTLNSASVATGYIGTTGSKGTTTMNVVISNGATGGAMTSNIDCIAKHIN